MGVNAREIKGNSSKLRSSLLYHLHVFGFLPSCAALYYKKYNIHVYVYSRMITKDVIAVNLHHPSGSELFSKK